MPLLATFSTPSPKASKRSNIQGKYPRDGHLLPYCLVESITRIPSPPFMTDITFYDHRVASTNRLILE